MKTFKDLELKEHPNRKKPLNGLDEFAVAMFSPTGSTQFNDQARLFFDNGYGVSVITGPAAKGNFEIAILKGTEKKCGICYDTGITDDVIACNTKEDITDVMRQVQELK